MDSLKKLSRDTRRILAAVALVSTLLLLAVLLFPSHVTDVTAATRVCGVCLATVLMLGLILPRLKEAGRSLLLAAGVLFVTGQLFNASAFVQHLLVPGWKDAELLALDRVLFGGELSERLQGITHPVLTEWLMAAYVLYVPMLPFTAWLCRRYGGTTAMERYLLHLVYVYLACDVGFILYPVASQRYFGSAIYTVPLEGGYFTAAGEWMRSTLHFPGGSLPSPHCAAGAVRLAHLIINKRSFGMIFAPLLASIFPATVYLRYHYVWDGLAGITLAGLILSPLLAEKISRTERGGRTIVPRVWCDARLGLIRRKSRGENNTTETMYGSSSVVQH